MTPADAITAARALIEEWHLYRGGYEHPVTGELDPSGALGIALFGEEHAGVWSSPHWTVTETPEWETGVTALRALVLGTGRWDTSNPDEPDIELLDAESLANQLAFWLNDPGAPTEEQVLAVMADVAASLTTNPIEIGAAA